MKSLLFVLFLAICAQTWASVRYDNFKLYRLTASNDEGLQKLKELEQEPSEIQFWNEVRTRNLPVDVLVGPKDVEKLESLIRSYEIDAVVLNSDIQQAIDAETKNVKNSLGMDWTSYHSWDEINDWLRSLVQQYPGVVELITVGRSYEGRDILGVKVSFSEKNENNAVFLEANIHAREWITSATATYILNELLTSKDSNVRAVAESHDWYIVPVFNPDGFVYTKEKDRLWRKTRVPYAGCYGTDPNRNWGYHWMDGGASNNPCSDTYGGPSAFSEPSTNSTSQFISSISQKLIGYIAFHSYSQLLLIPYGHTAQHLDNYDQLEEIGLKAAKSLAQRYNTKYTVGNIVETIYVASGGSMDWVKGTYKTPITYTYELRDTGRYGFLLPAEQIIPTGQETLDSLVTILEEYAKSKTN